MSAGPVDYQDPEPSAWCLLQSEGWAPGTKHQVAGTSTSASSSSSARTSTSALARLVSPVSQGGMNAGLVLKQAETLGKR